MLTIVSRKRILENFRKRLNIITKSSDNKYLLKDRKAWLEKFNTLTEDEIDEVFIMFERIQARTISKGFEKKDPYIRVPCLGKFTIDPKRQAILDENLLECSTEERIKYIKEHFPFIRNNKGPKSWGEKK